MYSDFYKSYMEDNTHLRGFFMLSGRIISFELVFWHRITITYAKEKTGEAERVKERAIERGW